MSLVLGWAVANSAGGERIQFSSQKAKAVLATENKLAKDKLSSLERAPSVSPYDVLNMSGASSGNATPRRDRKEEKRLEKARLEKENWMILDKGELQDQEDEETGFGIRDYSLEKEEKTAGDLWFGPKEDASKKVSGQSRAPNSISRGPSQNRQSDPGEKQANQRFENNSIQRSMPDLGDHTSKELNTRMMIGEPSSQPPKDLFGNALGTARSFDDRSHNGTDFGLRPLGNQGGASSLGRGFGLRGSSTPSASSTRIDVPRSQSGTPLGLGPSRPYEASASLNPSLRSSPSLQTPPRNQSAPTSTRELFAPPPRPGSFGNR